jgi:hypothetical protein
VNRSTIERVDLRTGKREPVLEFAPREPAGLVQAVARSVTPDGAAYAYECFRIRSTLFLVEQRR